MLLLAATAAASSPLWWVGGVSVGRGGMGALGLEEAGAGGERGGGGQRTGPPPQGRTPRGSVLLHGTAGSSLCVRRWSGAAWPKALRGAPSKKEKGRAHLLSRIWRGVRVREAGAARCPGGRRGVSMRGAWRGGVRGGWGGGEAVWAWWRGRRKGGGRKRGKRLEARAEVGESFENGGGRRRGTATASKTRRGRLSVSCPRPRGMVGEGLWGWLGAVRASLPRFSACVFFQRELHPKHRNAPNETWARAPTFEGLS